MDVTDHRSLKINNFLQIVRALREHGPMPRGRLKEVTSLSWGTITGAVRELIDRGTLVEIGKVRTGVGRMPVDIGLNRHANYAVGMRLGEAFHTAVVLDIAGDAVGHFQVPANPHDPLPALLTALYELFDLTVGEASLDPASVAGIGLATPGVVDSDRGVCRYAPHHPHWKDVPVRDLFEDRYGLPFFVEHNSNCAALGEKWFGAARTYRTSLSISIGNGIGIGIIIDGKVYRGADFSAGEFGHICLDPEGDRCACGKRGCLELFASGLAVARAGALAARDAAGARILAIAGGGPDRITAEVVSRAAREGDRAAREIFERMGQTLGISVANLVTLFNPECIVFNGGVSAAYDLFGPALEREVAERAWAFSRRELSVSTLSDPAVLGAAGIVLEEVYNSDLLFRHR